MANTFKVSWYPDLSWKELCGMKANLVVDSGCNKGQLSNLVEANCRDFRQRDEAELKKQKGEPKRNLLVRKRFVCDAWRFRVPKTSEP